MWAGAALMAGAAVYMFPAEHKYPGMVDPIEDLENELEQLENIIEMVPRGFYNKKLDLDDSKKDHVFTMKSGMAAVLSYEYNATITPSYRWKISNNSCTDGKLFDVENWTDGYVRSKSRLMGAPGTKTHSFTVPKGTVGHCRIQFYNPHQRKIKNYDIKVVDEL